MDESAIRASIEQRWAKPISGDLYEEDVILDFPQSGERIRGRPNLVAQRSADPDHPSIAKVLRIFGSGPVWVSEVIITYDGKPWYTVNIHEFRGDKVFHETQYFGEPLTPAAWRAQWVEQVKPD
ncbi:MAG: hypothetical protein WB491_11395 [Candidatus Aquilonibacter sp.]|jgi:hypothetical protein